MRVLVLVAALLFVAVRGDDPTETLPGVIDLTPENFDQHVNGGKHAIVEFYAPWCGHCKRMVPELKKLGEALQQDPKLGSRVVVAKVDADKHRSLGERFGIQGFPTIKFFGRGKAVTDSVSYEEGRTADAFLSFLTKKVEEDSSFARVEALDTIAKEFTTSDKDKALEDAEALLAGLSGDAAENGKVYIDVMKKALIKGDTYFITEKARVERILGSGSVHASKAEQLSRKASVLSAFVDEV